MQCFLTCNQIIAFHILICKFISKLNITINLLHIWEYVVRTLLHISCIPFLFYKKRKKPNRIFPHKYKVLSIWVFVNFSEQTYKLTFWELQSLIKYKYLDCFVAYKLHYQNNLKILLLLLISIHDIFYLPVFSNFGCWA